MKIKVLFFSVFLLITSNAFAASDSVNSPFTVSFGEKGQRFAGLYATTLTNATVYLYLK